MRCRRSRRTCEARPPVERDLRGLVIGRELRGYVALYRYVEVVDTVFVLAARSQSSAATTASAGEAGYAG